MYRIDADIAELRNCGAQHQSGDMRHKTRTYSPIWFCLFRRFPLTMLLLTFSVVSAVLTGHCIMHRIGSTIVFSCIVSSKLRGFGTT